VRDDVVTNEWAEHEREWRDEANWRGGWLGIYVAPRDPRLVVRKKHPQFGWTFNFAHRGSWLLLGALIGIPLVAVALTRLTS
jgi:uncharacterized membrane protein